MSSCRESPAQDPLPRAPGEPCPFGDLRRYASTSRPCYSAAGTPPPVEPRFPTTPEVTPEESAQAQSPRPPAEPYAAHPPEMIPRGPVESASAICSVAP